MCLNESIPSLLYSVLIGVHLTKQPKTGKKIMSIDGAVSRSSTPVFRGEIESCGSIELNNVTGLSSIRSGGRAIVESSQVDSITATDNIRLTDTFSNHVMSHKSEVEWKNKKQESEAQSIFARSKVSLLNINCKAVHITAGDFEAEKCSIGRIGAVKSVKLVQTVADKIVLSVNRNSPEMIVLDRSLVKGNVIILPQSDSDFRQAAIRKKAELSFGEGNHIHTSGNSFRLKCKSSELKKYESLISSILWEGAKGHYNDKPCIYARGQFVPNEEADAKEQDAVISVTLVGGKVDGHVIFSGCKGSVTLQKGASIKGTMEVNSEEEPTPKKAAGGVGAAGEGVPSEDRPE